MAVSLTFTNPDGSTEETVYDCDEITVINKDAEGRIREGPCSLYIEPVDEGAEDEMYFENLDNIDRTMESVLNFMREDGGSYSIKELATAFKTRSNLNMIRIMKELKERGEIKGKMTKVGNRYRALTETEKRDRDLKKIEKENRECARRKKSGIKMEAFELQVA